MPNTDLYREKKGDLCKTHCEEQIKNKNQGTKKKAVSLGYQGRRGQFWANGLHYTPPGPIAGKSHPASHDTMLGGHKPEQALVLRYTEH